MLSQVIPHPVRFGIALLIALSIALLGRQPWQAAADAPTPQKIAIPTYFYPDRAGGAGQILWNRTIAGYPTVGLVIANPGLYSLADPRIDPAPRANYDDPNYRAQVQESQAAGQLVLGYTHTQYGARDPFMVKSDIDLLYNLFNVDGIFLDEAPTDCASLAYFQDLHAYVKAKTLPGGGPVHGRLVVLNPGTQTDECYMGVSDIIVTFEDTYAAYTGSYAAPAWIGNYTASRFWHLVHTTATTAAMQNAVSLSQARNAGWVYVTPDAMPNPWDTLPPSSAVGSFWAEELVAVWDAPRFVWPISGTTAPDYPLSSTFGPRLKASQSFRYDWHRGIDIPAPCYTPVRAITNGVVRLAGDVSSYEDRVVQLRHYKPGRTSCSNEGCFYSNYMHMASVSVQVDQQIAVGQVIGLSGETGIGDTGVCTPGVNLGAGNGFDHLHFEIRDAGLYQQDAIHPLNYLPYTDAGAPLLRVDGVNALNPLRPIVSLSASLPPAELDLQRVEVIAYDNSGGGLTEVDRQTFDMLEWNALYTPVNNGASDITILDTAPAYDGVYDGNYGGGTVITAPLGLMARPARFNASSTAYKLDLTFSDLAGVANAAALVIQARAMDINGHATEVTAGQIMRPGAASHALYVWRSPATHGTPIDLTEAGRLADFAAAEGIETIYYDNWGCGAVTLACPASAGRQDAATLAPIIALFHGRGLRVEALYTDNTRIADVVSYNAVAPANARFDGLRLDIESFPGGGFGPTTAADLDVYVQAVAAAGFLPVNVSISPYWTTVIAYNSLNKPAYQHILEIVAGADVQTAQDTTAAIKTITQDEVCYANALGKPIHVTVETFDVVTHLGLNAWNSFFDEGEAVMDARLATLSYAGAPCGDALPAGFAYHFYRQSFGSPALAGWGTAAAGDSYATDEDIPLIVPAPGVLANDSDPLGQGLTARLAAAPAHGSLSLNADGALVYTPTANYAGADAFTYQARNSIGDLSAPATVTLTIRPVNDPPITTGDAYTIYLSTILNAAAPGVLANDSDIEGDTLSALLVSGPTHGGLALNPDGSFTYTPTAGYAGSDVFTYKANDGAADSNIATVSLTIQGQSGPTAVTIKVSDAGGAGRPGYLVRVYLPGGRELGNAWSNSAGLTTFTLTAGSPYEYLVEKNGARSAKIGFEAAADQTITYTLAKVTINVGRPGYLVRVYNGMDGGGAEWGNAWSDANGATAFYLVEGDYGYLVEKNSARSAKAGFTVARSADQTLSYTLAKITINVGKPGYLVRVYNGADGGGAEWGNAWSDAAGATNFYLVEGSYGYLVEKNSARSAKAGFTVARSTEQTLSYTLAKVTINVGRPGYLVRVYNGADGGGAEWGNAWSDATGATAFYLVEGSYGYLVEKNGARSAKAGFTVARSTDQTLGYTLAKITINVGRPGYLVRVYNGADGGGSEWGNAWSDATGATAFYLVEGDYGYLVEKNAARSAKAGFAVARSTDQTLGYTLAKVTINVGRPGYLVRVYNGTDGGGAEWGNAWSDANGATAFYLVEGDYGYLVEKNSAKSAKAGFTVARSADQTLGYTLAQITIHVQNGSAAPLAGYLIRFFNFGGGEWGNAWSNSTGDATFYLVEGMYQVQVEKNAYNSGKQPPEGFVVDRGGVATRTHIVP